MVDRKVGLQYHDWLEKLRKCVKDKDFCPDIEDDHVLLEGDIDWTLGRRDLEKAFYDALIHLKHDHGSITVQDVHSSLFKRFWGCLKTQRNNRREALRQKQLDNIDYLLQKEPEPYIEAKRVIKTRKFNPDYGDGRVCKCGHDYYRHFDTYEDMEPVGCKYCECFDFIEKTAIHEDCP